MFALIGATSEAACAFTASRANKAILSEQDDCVHRTCCICGCCDVSSVVRHTSDWFVCASGSMLNTCLTSRWLIKDGPLLIGIAVSASACSRDMSRHLNELGGGQKSQCRRPPPQRQINRSAFAAYGRWPDWPESKLLGHSGPRSDGSGTF